MHHFRYTGHDLHCESVDLAAVAKLYGTPTYVYSAATIADNFTRLQRGLRWRSVQPDRPWGLGGRKSVAVL